MKSSTTESQPAKGYQVVSVERVEPTEEMPGIWCKYVVKHGESKIEGLYAGGVDEVTEHAQHFVETLNERFVKKIYAYGSQRKKTTASNTPKQS